MRTSPPARTSSERRVRSLTAARGIKVPEQPSAICREPKLRVLLQPYAASAATERALAAARKLSPADRLWPSLVCTERAEADGRVDSFQVLVPGRGASRGSSRSTPRPASGVHFTTSAYCWAAVCPVTFVP
jgi:hypothetical protein